MAAAGNANSDIFQPRKGGRLAGLRRTFGRFRRGRRVGDQRLATWWPIRVWKDGQLKWLAALGTFGLVSARLGIFRRHTMLAVRTMNRHEFDLPISPQ
jgi:hypothetical protein